MSPSSAHRHSAMITGQDCAGGMELGSRGSEKATVRGSGRRYLDSKSLVTPRVTEGTDVAMFQMPPRNILVGSFVPGASPPSGDFP